MQRIGINKTYKDDYLSEVGVDFTNIRLQKGVNFDYCINGSSETLLNNKSEQWAWTLGGTDRLNDGEMFPGGTMVSGALVTSGMRAKVGMTLQFWQWEDQVFHLQNQVIFNECKFRIQQLKK